MGGERMAAALALLAACASATSGAGEPDAAPGADAVAAPSATACAAGTTRVADGTCVPAGVSPGECAPGFAPDGDRGCAPLLPDAACPPGEVAWLGETTCHEIVDCGAAPWGDVPVDAGTVFVDASFTGAGADGTRDRPWPTIGAAVAHAPPGAIVAIAAGTYAEAILLGDKPLRLWGRCPRLVEIVPPVAAACGAACGDALIDASAADGTEIHALAVVASQNDVGRAVVGWTSIYDAAFRNVLVTTVTLGGFVHVVRSLFEPNADGRAIGISTGKGELFLERSRIVGAGKEPGIRAADAIVRGSVVERTSSGIAASGSLVIAGSVLRDIVSDGITAERSLAVSGTIIENVGGGAILAGGVAPFERATVVATTLRHVGRANPTSRGIDVGATIGVPATADLVHLRVDDAVGCGACFSGPLVARAVGVSITGMHEGENHFGFGLLAVGEANGNPNSVGPAHLAVDGAVLDGEIGAALFVDDAEVTVDGSVLRATRPTDDGSFGDGASIVRTTSATASLRLTRSRLEGNARAGVSSFGATITIGDDAFVDDALDLDAENDGPWQPTFDDLGGNTCTSGGTAHVCAASSAGLLPPSVGP